VARSCSIAVSTVHEYLKRAEAAQISWPLPEGWDDTHLEAALYPSGEPKSQPKKSPPDFAVVHEQLRSHRHVTMQLLWEEYREANQDGYRYSRYVAAVFMLREHLKAMTVPGTGNVLAT
jgi:transposase